MLGARGVTVATKRSVRSAQLDDFPAEHVAATTVARAGARRPGMSKPDCLLTPVFGEAGYCGHVLRCARGFRAFDANDKPIGLFESSNSATAALLAIPTGVNYQ